MRVSILIALLGLTVSAQPAAAVDLKLIYTDQEVRPYLMGSGTEIPPRAGMTVDLVRRSLARIGGTHRLTLTRVTSRRLVQEIRAGRQDGVLGLRYFPERSADLVYPTLPDGQLDTSRRAARLAHSFYRRAGENVQWNGRRLTGQSGPVGTSLIVAENLHALGIETISVLSGSQLFHMLALHRIDAAATLDMIGDQEVAASQGAFEKLTPPLLEVDFHLPVSKRFYAANRDFVERLWRLMGELRDETYAELAPGYLF